MTIFMRKLVFVWKCDHITGLNSYDIGELLGREEPDPPEREDYKEAEL